VQKEILVQSTKPTMSNQSEEHYRSRERISEAVQQIHSLLNAGENWRPAKLLRECERLLSAQVKELSTRELSLALEGVFTGSVFRMTDPSSYAMAEIAVKRLMTTGKPGVRDKLAKALLQRVAHVLEVFGRRPGGGRFARELVALLLFLQDCRGSLSGVQLQKTAEQLEARCGILLEILLVHKPEGGGAAAVALGAIIPKRSQGRLLLSLREFFESGDPQMRDAIHSGIAEVLRGSIHYFSDQAIEEVCAWGRSLGGKGDSSPDALLGKMLVSLSQAEMEARHTY